MYTKMHTQSILRCYARDDIFVDSQNNTCTQRERDTYTHTHKGDKVLTSSWLDATNDAYVRHAYAHLAVVFPLETVPLDGFQN